jgi:copper homeostasis protein
MIKIEVVAYSFEDAVIAGIIGAHRIELCVSPEVGGITPSYKAIADSKELLSTPVHVMIRPRGGDFVYSDEEFETMRTDIEFCKKMKLPGVVFGILTKENTVDKKRCRELVRLAKPMTSNFHRAFDSCDDPYKAIEDIIDCGFVRILTSGRENKAIDGSALLSELIRKARGRIIIMPGGGIRKENFMELTNLTHAEEYHTSSIEDLPVILKSVKKLCNQ